MSEKPDNSVSALDEIRWAKENLQNRKKGPTGFATEMRDRMSENKAFFDKFVFTFYPKLLPKDAGEETGDVIVVDGVSALEAIDRMHKMLEVKSDLGDMASGQ